MEKSKRVVYDPEMMMSEHGRRLYPYWRRIKYATHSPEFLEYPKFYQWAMDNGYTVGAKLFKHEEDEEFSPDNCFWLSRGEWASGTHKKTRASSRDLEWEKEWDAVVNRIREHYGMEPIHSSDG